MEDKYNYIETLKFYKNRVEEIDKYIRTPNIPDKDKFRLINESIRIRSAITEIEYILNEA